MAKDDSKVTIKNQNREYFQALGSTRASVLMLRISWASIVVAIINLYSTYVVLTKNAVIPLASPFYLFLLGILVFNVLCLLFSFWYRLIFRHQSLFTAMLWAMIILLMLSLVIMCSSLFIYVRANPRLDDTTTQVVTGFVLSGLGFALVYNVIWLRKQLRKGFSKERTNANFFAASSVYSASSLWLIFGLTLIGGVAGVIFIRSWNGMFGILSTILFIGAFSRLIVEVGYLTYLRFTDKIYWEDMPEELKGQHLWTVLDIRKTSLRLILEFIVFIGFRVVSDIFHWEDSQNPIWLWIYRLLFLVLVVDASVSYIVCKVRQRKKGK